MLVGAGCNARPGRVVKTLVEARDGAGETVAGATVTVDGRPLGITDHRGLFRVRVRRHVGTTIDLAVIDDDPPQFWVGAFVVGTHGRPAGSTSDRLLVELLPGRPPADVGVPPLP